MNKKYPVYTINAECQDCYKCVRCCPVKAIRVENSHATVIPEMCVGCGICVEACPAHAKRIRNDLPEAKQLVKENPDNIYVSLAPSWISEFVNVPAERMIKALKALGIVEVSETALGAQIISETVANSDFSKYKSRLQISSACPACVDYIKKYLPDLNDCISDLLSPALAHCKFLRQELSDDIKIIFIGPCIAKKNEADKHENLMNVALTFSELKEWFEEENIDLRVIEGDPKVDTFFPYPAEEGAIYPVIGGMNRTINKYEQTKKNKILTVDISGLGNMIKELVNIHPRDIKENIFIETLSCEGGCINGPSCSSEKGNLLNRLRIERNVNIPTEDIAIRDVINVDDIKESEERTESDKIDKTVTVNSYGYSNEFVTAQQINEALKLIGKSTIEDELNCGGCGYNSCRELAEALVKGNAEPAMCVSYMRKLAQKQANALLKSIPAGVIIVNSNLEVVECNLKLAQLFGEDLLLNYEACPGLASADARRMLPKKFYEILENVLKNGHEISYDSFKVANKLYNISAFVIEKDTVAGAVVFDVTKNEMRREQIAERAREVIRKNLATVQEIACKLGENMADTEILLRSIADDYSDTKDLNKK